MKKLLKSSLIAATILITPALAQDIVSPQQNDWTDPRYEAYVSCYKAIKDGSEKLYEDRNPLSHAFMHPDFYFGDVSNHMRDVVIFPRTIARNGESQVAGFITINPRGACFNKLSDLKVGGKKYACLNEGGKEVYELKLVEAESYGVTCSFGEKTIDIDKQTKHTFQEVKDYAYTEHRITQPQEKCDDITNETNPNPRAMIEEILLARMDILKERMQKDRKLKTMFSNALTDCIMQIRNAREALARSQHPDHQSFAQDVVKKIHSILIPRKKSKHTVETK